MIKIRNLDPDVIALMREIAEEVAVAVQKGELPRKESVAKKAVKVGKAVAVALLAVGLSLPFLARAEEPLGASLYAAKRYIGLPAIGAAQVSSAPDTDATGRYYAFDGASDETCWFPAITLPADLTPSQTAEFRITWSADTTGTGTCYWNLQFAKANADGAIGSFSVLTCADANTGQNYQNVSAWTTLTTNLEPNQVISLKVTRDADYSGDTLNDVDALFQEVEIKISETIRN